jgi:hypothetical protein
MKIKSKKLKKKSNYVKKQIKKSKTKQKINKMNGGSGELNIETWNSLSNDEKNSLIEEANPYNTIKLKTSIEEVQNLYKDKYINKHLYDFIFSKDELKIIKIWDHSVSEPNSITGGLKGIHLYTIYENGKYLVIAKFIRN